ncbi:MAG: two pore domain potassium channel family protein [Flavobacteriales bacterium]|nr:two pore domain potassium channel family protein [Flavobacteriales bacterium]
MSFIDHKQYPFPYLILVLAALKTFIIASTTLKQLANFIATYHSVKQMLWIFGLLISLSIFSFATDYTCLYLFDGQHFEGIISSSRTYIANLYHFTYFSLTTFSTLGFGDIAPISSFSRFLVMLEIFLSFFIVVFAFTNIQKIHLDEKGQNN